MEFTGLGDPHGFCSQNSIPIIWIVNPITSPARQYVRQDKPFGGLISRRCPASERRHHHHLKFATRCAAVAPNTGPNPGIEAHLPNDPPNASVYYHNQKRSAPKHWRHGTSWFQAMRRAPISSGARSPDDIRGLLREFAPESATQARSEETSARASLRCAPHPHRH